MCCYMSVICLLSVSYITHGRPINVCVLLSGDHCESDYDGCQDNPCTAGTNCTDASPDEEVSSGRPYSCSECPEGTEKDGEKCLREHSIFNS